MYRCRVNGCDTDTSEFDEDFLSFSLPREYSAGEFLKDGATFDPCRVYKRLPGTEGCRPENFDKSEKTAHCRLHFNNTVSFFFHPSSTTEHCDAYVYDSSLYEATLTTELNLVCDQGFKVWISASTRYGFD